MLERIRSMIADLLHMQIDEVKPESTWADIELDSLDFVDIIMDI